MKKNMVRKALVALGLLLVFLLMGYLGCIESRNWAYITYYKNSWGLIGGTIIMTAISFAGWLCSIKDPKANTYIAILITLVFLISMALTMSSEFIEDIEGLLISVILVGPASIINWLTGPKKEKK